MCDQLISYYVAHLHLFVHSGMGGKDVAAAIRHINKGKKANEPVFDPSKLPPGSIIAVDLSTLLVPYVKTQSGTAQVTAVPLQSCTSIQDKLELMYKKKVAPRKWNLVLVIDGTFPFKDQVVRGSRNRTKELAIEQVNAIRSGHNFEANVVKKLRKAERGMASVTCDVVANAVEWAKKRPGKTCVSWFENVCIHNNTFVDLLYRFSVARLRPMLRCPI